ncbi:hypothetical protein SAMN04488130_11087 [Flavobacterium urumqiense]|uniref:Uncharacterized protein n=1 Tax=Flavobacterium urumqiense TaxID=935224 RepID=A0A1H5ZJK7_9FLAO|nr:hypothetical protein SAMN04488130_11087 [Flavobacterium urumqiense]
MKKIAIFISYHTILLFALFFTNSIIAIPLMPPPPPGLEEPPSVNIDLYMIPMVIVGIIFAFFFIKKNTNI